MEGVEFEENFEDFKRRNVSKDVSSSAMINFLIKQGIVKNEKQANSVFVAIIIISFALTFFILFHYSNSKSESTIPNGYKVVNYPGQLPEIVPSNSN